MNSLNCLTVAIITFFITSLSAQEVIRSSSLSERTDFKIGYFGNVTSNSGLNLGAEYLWKEKVKIKEKKKGQKKIKRQLLLN